MVFSMNKVTVKKFALVQFAIDANCGVVSKEQIVNIGEKAEYGVPFKVSLPKPKGRTGKAKTLMASILLFSDDEQALEDLKVKHDSMQISTTEIRKLQAAQNEDSEEGSSADEYPDSQKIEVEGDDSEGDRRSSRIRSQKKEKREEKEKKNRATPAEPSQKRKYQKPKDTSADEELLRKIKEQRMNDTKMAQPIIDGDNKVSITDEDKTPISKTKKKLLQETKPIGVATTIDSEQKVKNPRHETGSEDMFAELPTSDDEERSKDKEKIAYLEKELKSALKARDFFRSEAERLAYLLSVTKMFPCLVERAEALVSPATINISRHASATKQETCDTNNNYEALNRSVIEDDNGGSSCVNKSPSTFDLFADDKKIVKTNKDPDEQLEDVNPTSVNKNSRKKEESDFPSCEDDGDDGMTSKKGAFPIKDEYAEELLERNVNDPKQFILDLMTGLYTPKYLRFHKPTPSKAKVGQNTRIAMDASELKQIKSVIEQKFPKYSETMKVIGQKFNQSRQTEGERQMMLRLLNGESLAGGNNGRTGEKRVNNREDDQKTEPPSKNAKSQ